MSLNKQELERARQNVASLTPEGRKRVLKVIKALVARRNKRKAQKK